MTEAVLDRPEFQPSSMTIWERAIEWLVTTLPDWSEANPGLARLLMIVLTIILVVLLMHIAYTVVHEFATYRKRPVSARRHRRSLEALEEVGAESWTEAFGMASAALSGGDLYRGLWVTHRILLSVLDRMELVRFTRWKTNSDYLAECGTGSSAAETLADITTAYERVIYAHRDLDEAEARRLLSDVEGLAGTIES